MTQNPFFEIIDYIGLISEAMAEEPTARIPERFERIAKITESAKLAEKQAWQAELYFPNKAPQYGLPDEVFTLNGIDPEELAEAWAGQDRSVEELLASVFGVTPETTEAKRKASMAQHPSNFVAPPEHPEVADAFEAIDEFVGRILDVFVDNALLESMAQHPSNSKGEEVLKGRQFVEGEVLQHDEPDLDHRYVGTVIEDSRNDIFMLDDVNNTEQGQWFAWGDKHPSLPKFPVRIVRLAK